MRTHHPLRLTLTALVLALVGGLGCPRCLPGTVAEGIARLTVRNVGAMVTLVDADTRCGFASDAVQAGAVVEGTPGGPGSITTTVSGCSFDLGAGPTLREITTDCNGDITAGRGRFTIDVTKKIAGTLTGDATNPIVPGGPDAVTFTVTRATFDNFQVTKKSSTDALTMVSGMVSAVVKPRLAVSASTGACAIPTLNTSFSDVRYGKSTVHVRSPKAEFDADVESSDFVAQNGKNGLEENSIDGILTVFNTQSNVQGDNILDPNYDAAVFRASYACNADISLPESFTCADLAAREADGVARLSIKTLGTVASLADADTTCGFSSPAVASAVVVQGTPGGTGQLTFKVDACRMTFRNTALPPDCNGVSTVVDGSVVVSGTKTVVGRLTGDPAQPIIPVTDQPASFALTTTFDGFSVSSTADENALLAKTGTLAGIVRPRVFLGADTGVCSVPSPNASFANVTWTNGDLALGSAAGSFDVTVDASLLAAVNGSAGGRTNALSGTVTIGGHPFDVPSDGAGLDPVFTQGAFDASWQCNTALAQPVSTACATAVGDVIGSGAAALSVRTFGVVTQMIDADSNCGFASAAVAGAPTFTGGGVGDPGVTATFSLGSGGCALAFPVETAVSVDCNGNTTSVVGTVVVTGEKSVTGFATGDPLEPIVPTSFEPAAFTLSMAFTGFTVIESSSTQELAVASGSLSGTVRPRTALDPQTGACSVATPNAAFADLSWQNGVAALHDDGSSITITIDSSNITAQAGTDGTVTNAIGGTIVVDNIATRLKGSLDPKFDPVAFDASFLCDAGSGVPVLVDDAACSFREVLGNAAARLLVRAAGTATAIVHDNAVCGFANPAPATPPVQTGTPGSTGNLTLTADANCPSAFPADTIVSTDCSGAATHVAGTFTANNAHESINGFLTGAPASPIFPVTRDAATFTMAGLSFATFSVSDPTADITITGALDVVVHPIAGRSVSASAAASAATAGAVTDVFSVQTPVAGFSALTMPRGTLSIVTAGKTFHIAVSDVALDAFAGSFGGVTNTISGSLKVDGEQVDIPMGAPLLTPYDQAAFDASYACNPDLGGDIVPP